MIPCETACFFLKCCKLFMTHTEQCKQNHEEIAQNQPSYTILIIVIYIPQDPQSELLTKLHSVALCHCSCPKASCCCGQWNGAVLLSSINAHLPGATPGSSSGSAGTAAVAAPAGHWEPSPGPALALWKDTVLLSSWGIKDTRTSTWNARMFYRAAFRDWNNPLTYLSCRRDSSSVKLVCTNIPCKNLPVLLQCPLFCIEQHFLFVNA